MAQRFKSDLKWSDVTSQSDFLDRRQVMAGMGAAGLIAASPATAKIATVPSKYSSSEKANSFKDITKYNNFYEFGTGKGDPAKFAHKLTVDPWSVKIDGMVDKPGAYDLADLTKGVTMEERIYRFRCVEAWAMVIPWVGFELSTLLNRVGVQSGAKYISFETLERPEEMIGQKARTIPWPYREGLRIDEAMHPLTILATGLYGDDLPKQNGAPLRLVVPWKYGFKSIKSIVRITATNKQPKTSWNMINGREYGFYSNVNPTVDHPRWSQATERKIGGLIAKRQETLMFNGYEKQVAGMYKNMDLKKYY